MTRELPPAGAGDAWEGVLEVPDGAGGWMPVVEPPPFDPVAFDEQLARWKAWAEPAAPSSMTDEPELHRLRERWPVGGGGDGPRDMAALMAEWRSAGILSSSTPF